MLNIKLVNQKLKWTGMQLAAERQRVGIPIQVEVRLDDFQGSINDKWLKVNQALKGIESQRSFVLCPISDVKGALMACLIPIDWLEDWFESWYQFDRYLGFLIFPQEEETRPIGDPMASAYPVLQKDERLVEGYYAVHRIFEKVREIEKTLKKDQFVLRREHYVQTVGSIIKEEAFDDMMIYTIKNLPEYTDSQMEYLGEDLWKIWKQIREQYDKGVI